MKKPKFYLESITEHRFKPHGMPILIRVWRKQKSGYSIGWNWKEVMDHIEKFKVKKGAKIGKLFSSLAEHTCKLSHVNAVEIKGETGANVNGIVLYKNWP